MKRRLVVATVFISSFILMGCVKDFVTGQSTFSLLSEGQEIALGKQSHESVLDQYGLYGDDRWQSYVAGIGEELAKVSHRPQLDYHFYVVDSHVVNAFALPGGWVYFTRGILAHFNSEDELAGVMGHEIGHVVARHGAEQYSRSQLAGIGLEIATVASETFAKYRQFAEIGTSLLFLKFSRNQESESDKLGVSYSTKVGYDAHQMAGFFRTIARLSGEGGQSIPNFLSTHPNPVNREKRVHEMTKQYRAESGYQARNEDANAYLRRLEGLVYGEDPRDGYLDQDAELFYHPRWRIQFPVPKGWKFQRNRRQFQMLHPEEKGIMLVSKHKDYKNPESAANTFFEQVGGTRQSSRNVNLGGYRGVRIETKLSQNEQNYGLISYFIGNGTDLYEAHGYTSDEHYNALKPQFMRNLEQFDRLTNRTALNKKPDRIRIKPAPRNDSLENNLKRLGMKADAMKSLSILNGMELNKQVPKGKLLKTIGR